MKFGNFILKCVCLQIFIAFTFFAYAQTKNEDLHKHKMIEAINSGRFDDAIQEIDKVENWIFDSSNGKDFLYIHNVLKFVDYYKEFTNLSKCNIDSLLLYSVEMLYPGVYYAYQQEKFDMAINFLKIIIDIQREILGVDNEDYALSLFNLANIYLSMKSYSNAVKLYEESLSILKKSSKKDLIFILNNLADAYSKIGNYSGAEKILKEILDTQQKNLGIEHPNYLVSLSNLAGVYFNAGNYAESEKKFKDVLGIKEKVLGVKHLDYAISLNDLAMVYAELGSYDKAQKMIKVGIEIIKNEVGENNLDYIDAMSDLALIYSKMGDHWGAEKIYKEVLGFCKMFLENGHPYYVKTLHSLADLYVVHMGNYIEAEKAAREALEIVEVGHIDYANILGCLALIYFKIGNYVEAELLYKESLQVIGNVLGIEHLDYAKCLNNFANLYLRIENYVEAELLYKESLNIKERLLGKQHPDYARGLCNLANLYLALGNYSKAELLYEESLKIRKDVLGIEYYDYSENLMNMASLYLAMGNYQESVKLYKDAEMIIENIFGINHPIYARNLSNLACAYLYNGDYDNAQKEGKEALRILRRVLGKKHPHYASTLNVLALNYLQQGDYSKSKKLSNGALQIRKEIFGIKHLSYATSLCNLSYVYFELQQYCKAEPLLIEHSNIIKKHIKTNFEFLSEKERQLYWNTQSHHFNIYYPSFCYSYYPQKKSISEFAYNNAILTKGLLLNASTQVQNAILNSCNQMLIDQWNELCGLRQQIVFLQNKTLEEPEKAGVAALEERANELDKQLTASSSEFKQGKEIWDIEWDDVKKKLKTNEVAIEFISFDYYHKGEFTDSTLYCALLLRNNSQYPEMITLFEEKDILPYISSKIEANVTNKIYDFYANGEVIKNKIWGNILPKIKEGETVYFSPSGLFHQLAIESLPYDENRKMSDVYNFVRLSSTREIVLNKNNSNQYSTATLYGGINYNTTREELALESSNYSQAALLASRGVENDTLNRGSVNYLPGTKKEVEKINEMLVDNNITAQLYTKNQANEESFKNLSNKHQNIIHIGTHGFTWTDSVAKKKDYFAERMQMIGDEQQYRGPIIDPLNRCGLLFAGANIALSGKSRELPEGVQDGILTAKEISLLDLRDCDLVVLSACETAKGDITSEGVFGLQRAFKMAGVQTIIMSLWKVNDEATQMLMTEFYNNWIVKKQTKREAFNNAQNAVRKEYEEPEYWAGFVMLD